MESKLKSRVLVILFVFLVCVFGIVGFPRNLIQLKDNLRNRIRLGLDLKGGTHLILQVQVEDAVKITTDQALERLRDELKAKNVPYADIQKTDSTHILIKGIPQERSSDVQDLASGQFSDWDLSRVAGDATARTLSLKVSAATGIRNQALQQAMTTIRNRIDQL